MTLRTPETSRPAGVVAPPTPRPRVEALRVVNFRALRRFEIEDLTPLTVFIGPNGSGKSTVFEVFAFLSECFDTGLRGAWSRRGGVEGIRTLGKDGPVTVEIEYRECANTPSITYHLEITEEGGEPVVGSEWMSWKRKSSGTLVRFLEFRRGQGRATGEKTANAESERNGISLQSPDLLAVDALGQFHDFPRIAALRAFLRGWRVSPPSANGSHTQPGPVPRERRSGSEDDLASVVRYFSERHPDRLRRIFELLQRWVPRFEGCRTDRSPDGRLRLQIEDAPFERSIPAGFGSDGTLRMLARLVLLHAPEIPPLLVVEAPEGFVHPRILPELAEEFRVAAERAQLLVTTHSPFFLDALRPEEVHILWRDEAGHTQSRRVADADGVPEFVREGANLGSLWTEGHFGVGDPLTRSGGPIRERSPRSP